MKFLLVTEPGSLRAAIPGGVQLCTADFLSLLQACGRVDVFEIESVPTVRRRLLMKLGLDVYGKRYAPADIDRLVSVIRRDGIDVVAINQVSLLGIATHLRRVFGARLRIVCLSHGNESGDYLHEVARSPGIGRWRAWRDTYVLGALLVREARFFIDDVDLVLAISETERQIDHWLGAAKTILVPRCYAPKPLDWAPVPHRIGFLGSLHHRPNADGLCRFLDALRELPGHEIRVRVVGGPDRAGRELAQEYSGLEYLGALPDHAMLDELATWSLFINPVFWYSRGASTKLAVAINHGIPFLTSSPGARGYEWPQPGPRFAETPAAMARESVRLLADPSALQAARAFVVQAADHGPRLAAIAETVLQALRDE